MLPQELLFQSPRAPALRPYQRAIINRIDAAGGTGQRRLLVPAPTGSGKTIIAARVAAGAVTGGKPVLFLVHRRELVQQASRKLHDAGLDHGIIAAGFPMRPEPLVQVASIATLHRRAVRSSVVSMPAAAMLLVDEAHHASARTWKRIIDAYPGAIVIGLTATPCRSDGRGLGAVFDALIECPSIRELIEQGYLVPTRVFAPTKPDLEGIRTIAGDFDEVQLEERLDEPVLVGDIVTHWHRLAGRRRTVVFAISRAHAVHLRDEFARSGVVSCYLDGDTPLQERDQILEQLKSAVEVVVNVGVLTEGWDQPEVQCIVLARPTKSFGLYRQIVGRGLRPAPGKDHLLVLDHAGATHMHQPVETDVVWSLSEKTRAQPAPLASGLGTTRRRLIDCPECSAVFWQGQACPACGWRPRVKPDAVDVRERDLVLLQHGRTQKSTHSDLDKRNFHRQLLSIRNERGYQRGWPAYTFKKKFGAWPPWAWQSDEPLGPSDEVRAYVRSRQIAYRKALQKASVS